MKNPPKFEIFCRGDGKWAWRLRAYNGLLLATAGEGFYSRYNAVRAARAMRKNFQWAVDPESN